MDANETAETLELNIPQAIFEKRRFGRSGEISFWVETRALPKIAMTLRNDPKLSLDWLENLSAIEVDNALVLTYFLRSTTKPSFLILRGSVVPEKPDGEVEVPSVIPIWPMALWMEREIQDLFGVRFIGNPVSAKGNTILPQGWKGFPLRKAYVRTEGGS